MIRIVTDPLANARAIHSLQTTAELARQARQIYTASTLTLALLAVLAGEASVTVACPGGTL